MTAAVKTLLQARVKRTDLTRALKHVAAIAAKKPVIPVLGCVRIEVLATGFMTLLGTDLGSAVRMTIPVESGQPGVVLVPARQLHTLLTFSMAEDVELAQVGADLSVRAGDDEFTMTGFGDDRFPTPDSAEGIPFFVIARSDLAEIATSCGPVCGTDESKPWLQTIYFQGGDILQATSTDGVRIGVWDKPVPIHNTGNAMTLPAAVRMAVQLAAPGEQIQAVQLEHHIKFMGHGFEVWSQAFVGKYPDVRAMAPKECPISVTVERLALLTAMRAARVLSKAGEVKLAPGSNWLQVHVNTPDVGTFTRLLPATVSGEMGAVGFNSNLVFKLLESFRGNEVTWSFKDDRSPARLACADQPHMSFIIMPLITF